MARKPAAPKRGGLTLVVWESAEQVDFVYWQNRLTELVSKLREKPDGLLLSDLLDNFPGYERTDEKWRAQLLRDRGMLDLLDINTNVADLRWTIEEGSFVAADKFLDSPVSPS